MNMQQIMVVAKQAMANGDDVSIDIKSQAAGFLRFLADRVEAGDYELGLAELKLSPDTRPYVSYVFAVKDANR